MLLKEVSSFLLGHLLGLLYLNFEYIHTQRGVKQQRFKCTVIPGENKIKLREKKTG